MKVYGGPGYDWAINGIQTFDGGYIFVCEGDYQIYKLDAWGNIEWRKNINVLYTLSKIIQLNDSGFVFAGNGYDNIILIRTNKFCDTLWIKYHSYNEYITQITSVKSYNNSGYIICGNVLFPQGTRAYILRTDLQGNLIWQNDYMDSTNTGAVDIIALPSGSIYFTSFTYNNIQYGLLNKIDNNGTRVWANLLITPTNSYVRGPASLVQENSITITISVAYNDTGAIAKYDTNGSQIFFRSYPQNYGKGGRFAKALNGDYLFTSSWVFMQNWDVTFLRLDSLANVRFFRFINTGGEEFDAGWRINKTNDNGSIIAGYTSYGDTTDNTNMLMIKTDSTGYVPPLKIISNTEIYPDEFKLHANYPNPFNMQTNFRVEIPKKGNVSAIIYNTMGQEVEKLYEGILDSGEHLFIWNVKSSLSSGVYFIKVAYNSTYRILKSVLVK